MPPDREMVVSVVRLKAIAAEKFPDLILDDADDAASRHDGEDLDDLLSFLTTEIWNSDVLQSLPEQLTTADSALTGKQRRTLLESYGTRLAVAVGEHLVSLGYSQNDAESLTICIGLIDACCSNEDDEPAQNSVLNNDAAEEAEDAGADGDNVPPGHCAMCVRYMPLTFHHLVPKMVQKAMLKRGLFTKETVYNGVDICRPCHSAVHSRFDHETLATQMNTLEKLMDDEGLQRWVRYAEKQRVVSKDHAIRGLRYRR